ncbi:hypothetical protein [Prevotella aurantiaca]
MENNVYIKKKNYLQFLLSSFLPQQTINNKAHFGKYAFIIIMFFAAIPMKAQMLFSENLTLDIDSTKTIQGSLQPEIDFKTEKKHVFTIKNTANLNVLIKQKRIINLINKLEINTVGDKIAVSEGHVHAEYRYLLYRVFEVYPYAESLWAGSRGMVFKLSTGLQARYRFVNTDHLKLFANTALFYEFEKWEDVDAPTGTNSYLYSRSIKNHLSLTLEYTIGEKWDLIATAIHQTKPKDYFRKARFGGAVDLIYHITPKIGIRGAYRFIYDSHPIVSIGKNYTAVNAGLDIAF